MSFEERLFGGSPIPAPVTDKSKVELLSIIEELAEEMEYLKEEYETLEIEVKHHALGRSHRAATAAVKAFERLLMMYRADVKFPPEESLQALRDAERNIAEKFAEWR